MNKRTKKTYTTDLKKVGQKLRQLRKDAGYSSFDHFAWEHKIPRNSYVNLEQGKNFQFTTLLRILEIHGISIKEFFSDME